MPQAIERILTYISQRYGFDFPARQNTLYREKILDRAGSLGLNRLDDYLSYLKISTEEEDRLLDFLTINVSRFFRTPLTFEYLAHNTLPALLSEKNKGEIRIWSAGCAMGEEPYSIAILTRELMKKRNIAPRVRIFATDINPKILKQAEQGIYLEEQIMNVRHGLVADYFKSRENRYHLSKGIKKMVSFSFYDMMDTRTYVPPESVFGNFDLVLCRNLLIYFSLKNQQKIFDKLFRALRAGGCLVLGTTETVPEAYSPQLVREIPHCPVFRKPGPHSSPQGDF